MLWKESLTNQPAQSSNTLGHEISLLGCGAGVGYWARGLQVGAGGIEGWGTSDQRLSKCQADPK